VCCVLVFEMRRRVFDFFVVVVVRGLSVLCVCACMGVCLSRYFGCLCRDLLICLEGDGIIMICCVHVGCIMLYALLGSMCV